MRFYQSLRFKITLLFVALMILGNATALYLANDSVTEKYSRYVNQSDMQRATMAAQFIADSWDQWKENKNRIPKVPDMTPRTGMGRNMNNMSEREPVPFSVTDLEGNIIYSSGSSGERGKHIDDYKKGIPIVVDGQTEGYVLAGTMIAQEMSHFDQAMIRDINKVLIFTNIFSTLAILAIGIVLLGRMLSPLKKIDRAAADLSQGMYAVRTGISGTDEIGNLGVRFDHMAQSLEASEEWKRRIIADTAHELRTPVSLVLSRLEMIKDGIYPVDETQLGTLYREVENFSRLIREMQKLAGMEGGTVTLEMGEARLDPFCLGQLQSFLPESRKKGITLLCEGELVTESFGNAPAESREESDRIHADWNRLEQVMKNLLSNALRHTPEGGSVELWTLEQKDSVVISIADSGPGIPPEERTKIFDRFYRLDSSRNREQGGSGLGLAISKAIVEAHGGIIEVGNSSLGGAEFRVTLPR